MNEKLEHQTFVKRIFLWFAIIVPFALGYYPVVPSKPEYIVTIANGLLTAQSMLVALATFSIEKRKNKRWSILYLLAFLLLLLLNVVGGYQLILTNELSLASDWFMTMFILSCCLLGDLWITSEFV